MKSNTTFTSTRISSYPCILLITLLIMFSSAAFFGGRVNALEVSNELASLTEDEYVIYSQNDIFFAAPGCTDTGGSSSICGDTAKEMYWSALSQYTDDPIKVAGIVGNLMHEGGMNPVAWEGTITNSDGSLAYSWDYIYGGGLDGEKGVGAFGITSGLGTYLHYINDNYPDLLKYFKDSKEYSFSYMYPGSGADPTYGDTLLKKIGSNEYAKLVEAEVKFAMEDSDTFSPRTKEYMGKSFSSPMDSAYWWASEWERCGTGCLNGPNSAENIARGRTAEKVYDELKDFKCSPGSSANSTTKTATSGMNSDITLIGDSIAVQSEAELQSKFPGSFMSKVGSRHPTSMGACPLDEGGLDILKRIASGSGEVADYSLRTFRCEKLKVDANSLKENVVWELGTNSTGANADVIKKIISIIGQRKLFLVTPYNGDDMDNADAIAKMYRKFAADNDNVYVVDWNEAVRYDAEKYITTTDGMAVHPTPKGRQLLADLIAEAVESKASCAIATYKHPAYEKRLKELHNFNQWRGPWSNYLMCPGNPDSSTMGDGCGIMSMFAMYYMFSGEGLNDDALLNGFLEATMKDGYNVCSASNGNNWGEESTNYTGMVMKPEDAFWNGRNYLDSDWDTLVNALKQGKKILIGTTGPKYNGPSKFGYGGHYIFFDHYNEEKQAIYLFDPSMGPARARYATSYGPGPEGENFYNGVYIDRETMLKYVVPDEARPVTYYGQNCMICEDESIGLISGGMTYEQAVKFMQPYVDEASKKKKDDYGAGFANGSIIGPGWVYDAGCRDGALNNCVAFSQWFINNYTTAHPEIGTNSGNGYVDTLISDGYTDGGSTPRPYAVFSTGFESENGHTGVVLGINKEKNEIYIGEAGCGGFDAVNGWPGVHIGSLDEYTSGAYKYAYTDGRLRNSQTLTAASN